MRHPSNFVSTTKGPFFFIIRKASLTVPVVVLWAFWGLMQVPTCRSWRTRATAKRFSRSDGAVCVLGAAAEGGLRGIGNGGGHQNQRRRTEGPRNRPTCPSTRLLVSFSSLHTSSRLQTTLYRSIASGWRHLKTALSDSPTCRPSKDLRGARHGPPFGPRAAAHPPRARSFGLTAPWQPVAQDNARGEERGGRGSTLFKRDQKGLGVGVCPPWGRGPGGESGMGRGGASP